MEDYKIAVILNTMIQAVWFVAWSIIEAGKEKDMKFKITDNKGRYLGHLYAPNYDTALGRAVSIYGIDVEVEEV